VDLAESVGGKDTHNFKLVQVPFNIFDNEVLISDNLQRSRLQPDKTDTMMKVAEELGLLIQTVEAL